MRQAELTEDTIFLLLLVHLCGDELLHQIKSEITLLIFYLTPPHLMTQRAAGPWMSPLPTPRPALLLPVPGTQTHTSCPPGNRTGCFHLPQTLSTQQVLSTHLQAGC